jgi:glycosyltransferase involved in cell wall biosynthesis
MKKIIGGGGKGPSAPYPSPKLPTPTPYCGLGREFSSRSARVVFLLQDLKFGGTQRQALELARRLDPAHFRPEIWLLAAGRDLESLARDWGVPVTWLSRREKVGPGALLNLWRSLRRGEIDLLMPFTVVPNIWGRILGRLARVPAVVGNCRGGGAPRRQGERWLWPLAHHIVCNSAALQEVLTRQCGVPEARLSLIRNGVDTEYFQPKLDGRGPSSSVVLSVGRMVPDKDHETLLRAFALVARTFPGAELWLVGEGPLLEKIRQLASEILSPGTCCFLPPQSDLRPLFRQAGLLALSSRTEALPNVVLEAMASGLPVAATAVGGVPEMVLPAETGWLAPAGDAPALAAALGRLLGDPEQCQSFGRGARRRVVQEFSMNSMVGHYEEVLRACLPG